LDKAIDRLESYTGLLSILSKRNPEIVEKYEELSTEISALREMNKESEVNSPSQQSSPICDSLLEFYHYFWDWCDYYLLLADELYEKGRLILAGIFLNLSMFYFGLAMSLAFPLLLFDCIEYPY
jgi:hypothetical protein